jgi:hypothetical protein
MDESTTQLAPAPVVTSELPADEGLRPDERVPSLAVQLPEVSFASTMKATIAGFIEIDRDGTITRGSRGAPLPRGLDPSAMLRPQVPARVASTDKADATAHNSRIAGTLGSGWPSSKSVSATLGRPRKALPMHASGTISDWVSSTISEATVVFADRDVPAISVLGELTDPASFETRALAVATNEGVRAFQVSFRPWPSDEPEAAYFLALIGSAHAHLTAVTADALDPKVFDRTVAGDATSIAVAFAEARKIRKLGNGVTVWLQLRDDVSYARLIAVLEALGAVGARSFAISRESPTAVTVTTAASDAVIAANELAELGTLTVDSEGLDRAVIRRYLKRNISKLTYCYEKARRVSPAEGTVTITFKIGETGSVVLVRAEGLDQVVSSCLHEVVQHLEFPAPKAPVTVTVPVTFGRSGASRR